MKKGHIGTILGITFFILISVSTGFSQMLCTETTFDDVTVGTVGLPFCYYIERIASLGITGGCSVEPPLYCPDASVTRGQMAVFLTSALDMIPEIISEGPCTTGQVLSKTSSGFACADATSPVHTHSGSDIVTGTVFEARIDSLIARDSEVTSAIANHATDSLAHHTRYTDAEAVAAIKAADGTGSGLDADFLNGQHASAFAPASHNHDTEYVNVTGDTMTGTLILPENGLVAGTDQLVVYNGNVGIGTATPSEKLVIDGNLSIPVTTATSGMIKSGGNRFIHNYGPNNFFAGTMAGNLTMTGSDNTAIGSSALYSNSTGFFNTATGVDALYSNTTGYDNTASGVAALYSNSAGFSNTAIGSHALYFNTEGGFNTATGWGALLSNTTGFDNTASGASALSANTTGTYNTASGSHALAANTEGSWNTATGEYALYHNTTGVYNTSSGAGSLFSNTTGDWNTAIGVGTLLGSAVGSHNTALGHGAGENSNGSYNTFIGTYSKSGTSSELTNATAIGYKALVSESNSLVLGATGADQVNVGIGTQAPEWMLHVNGTAAKPGGGSWTDSSDIRLKKGVRPIEDALDKILSLHGVEFEWNEQERADLLPGIQMGMIAQEVETVFPQWVGTDRRGFKDLTIRGFEALAIEAMRELKAENEALKSRLSDLEKRLQLLEGRVSDPNER